MSEENYLVHPAYRIDVSHLSSEERALALAQFVMSIATMEFSSVTDRAFQVGIDAGLNSSAVARYLQDRVKEIMDSAIQRVQGDDRYS